jgi:hypothetical protein
MSGRLDASGLFADGPLGQRRILLPGHRIWRKPELMLARKLKQDQHNFGSPGTGVTAHLLG